MGKKTVTQIRKEKKLESALSGTHFQVLEALVPDIEERIQKNPEVMREILRRAQSERGYNPFAWLLGDD